MSDRQDTAEAILERFYRAPWISGKGMKVPEKQMSDENWRIDHENEGEETGY